MLAIQTISEIKMHRLYKKRSLKLLFGDQPESVLSPKLCYNEQCYKEIQVYL